MFYNRVCRIEILSEGVRRLFSEEFLMKDLFADELKRILAERAELSDERVAEEMFKATDRNNDGRITFIEFISMMSE